MLRGRKVTPPTSSYGLRGAPPEVRSMLISSPVAACGVVRPAAGAGRELGLDDGDLVRRGVPDPDAPVRAAGQGVHLGALDAPLVQDGPGAGVELVDVAVVGLHHAERVVRLVPE